MFNEKNKIAMYQNFNDYEVYRDLCELAEMEFEEYLAEYENN